jgi:hypothetical protein
MEAWLTHAVQVYLERYDCMRAVVLGHSHGAITAEVVAARLEGQYSDRIAYVVGIDRFEGLYTGDLSARPATTPFLNIFIEGGSRPYESPNATNVDASGEEAPRDGEEGGPMEPVSHTTVDNSRAVRERIVDTVIDGLSASSAAR